MSTTRLSTWFATLGLLLSSLATGEAAKPTDVQKISAGIMSLQPRLQPRKVVHYARAIATASKRYNVSPVTLVAIAHQESSFRENLPEGGAGEYGLCQIQKIWLKNPQFIAEFGRRRISDLNNPVLNFMFAAWILHDLKSERGTLPFWSFYNARKFENRLKYFQRVNEKIVRLKRLRIFSDNHFDSQPQRKPAAKPIRSQRAQTPRSREVALNASKRLLGSVSTPGG